MFNGLKKIGLIIVLPVIIIIFLIGWTLFYFGSKKQESPMNVKSENFI